MKKLPALTALAVFLAVGAVNAENAIIDFQGYAWETGGFPPSNVDDILSIVGVVDSLDPRFSINLLLTEVTLYATDLVSQGQVDVGGGVLAVSYSGGTIALYDDPARNHDYGINPPNPTAPPTFVDGTLFLGGTLDQFSLFLDTTTGSGAYEAWCHFTAGTGLATLNQIDADGYTFGGVLTSAAAGGNVPQGYDLQVDGLIEVFVRVGVEPKTWGSVKEMYRR